MLAEEEQTNSLPNVSTDDNKRKRNVPKKVPEAVKEEARKNLTLDLSKGTVHFDKIVLVKVVQKQKMVLLKGYSSPNSAFYKKRRLDKLNMHLRHLQRNLTPRHFCFMDIKAEPVETSENIEFDVDAFLASIPRPPGKTEPRYPRCLVDMTFGSI